MLRFEFHTGMIRNAIVRFPRSDIDLACGDKRLILNASFLIFRFNPSFFIDLGFEPAKEIEKEEGMQALLHESDSC